MSNKFQSSIQHRGDMSYVKLGGVIDEDNELADLVDKIPAGTAVIDLGEVERINSCGVRDWVNWLSKLEYNGTRSVLVECSPAIVAQINLVNNFTGNGVVKSFYVPYFCPECDEEKVLLVEATDMGPPPHEPPTCRCDECDLVMDFDDMPDSYFAFLSNQRKLPEPDKVNGAMRDLGRGSEPDPQKSGKVRSRASQPNLASGAKPSVPSLPSYPQRGSHPVPMAVPPTGGRGYPQPPSRPQLGAQPPTGPAGPGSRPAPMVGPMSHMSHPQMGHAPQMGHPQMGHPQIGHPQLGHAPQMGHAPQAGHPHMGHAPQLGHAAQPHIPAGRQSGGPMGAVSSPSGPNALPSYSFGNQGVAPVARPQRSNALVFVLIVVLMAAIAVLAYLVMTKQ
jgi:anti-anti-sigma regulatory factor